MKSMVGKRTDPDITSRSSRARDLNQDRDAGFSFNRKGLIPKVQKPHPHHYAYVVAMVTPGGVSSESETCANWTLVNDDADLLFLIGSHRSHDSTTSGEHKASLTLPVGNTSCQ